MRSPPLRSVYSDPVSKEVISLLARDGADRDDDDDGDVDGDVGITRIYLPQLTRLCPSVVDDGAATDGGGYWRRRGGVL